MFFDDFGGIFGFDALIEGHVLNHQHDGPFNAKSHTADRRDIHFTGELLLDDFVAHRSDDFI